MTSDFDNDEIQDSAFPVEFNDDTSSLDLYGVWVKSGPRDAETPVEKAAVPSALPEFSAELNDYSDISLLPDLPDFSALAESDEETPGFTEEEALPDFGSDLDFETETDTLTETPIENETVTEEPSETGSWDDETITFDEIVPDFSNPDPEPDPSKEISSEYGNFSVRSETESVSETEFDTLDGDAFFETKEDTDNTEINTDESFSVAFDDSEIVFEDVQSEELGASSLPSKKVEPAKKEVIKEPAVSRVFESVDIFEIDEPETAEAASSPESDVMPEALPEFSDSPEFDLDDSFGTEPSPVDSETFELEEPGSLSNDTSDLDSFISDFNESGGTAPEEKDKLFSGLDPVDIDLDFDESFISDAEKIKATGSAVTKSEFLESEFGVEMIEETTDSSDSVFGESSVIDPDFLMSGEKSAAGAVPADIQDTDEFDELLESLDRTPSPVQSVKTEETSQKNLYDLSVTEDDGEEILDIPSIKDYNRSESSLNGGQSAISSLEGSVSLDFDDISAVEQELIDFTPETGDEEVNDKSTQLLMMIADELSSIKKELSTLKTEIAGFKASGNPADQGTLKTDIDDTDNSGFFNDDDTDETIALTGDELNNILITADFTEEKNEDIDAAGRGGIETSPDGEVEKAEINFETPSDMGDFNGFSADLDENDIPDTLPDSIFEVPDLESSIPVEPAHVNKIEDDTSYLEGSDLSDTILDDLSMEEPDLEIIDFNDEKLEEPELDEFNIDLATMDSTFPPEQDVSIPVETGSFEPAGTEPIAEPAVSIEPAVEKTVDAPAPSTGMAALPVDLKDEIKSVLAYMDQLLESLPEEKIEEFARSEHFEVYRKLFEELGIS